MLKIEEKLGLRTNPTIFFWSAGIALFFVVTTIAFTDAVDTFFGTLSALILENLGWFYILGVTTFVIFLLWIAFSRYGHVRLGDPGTGPEHTTATWFGMLFAAGIGTILMFWGVAEPISHYANPPQQGVEPESVQSAKMAMGYSLYHFGLHTWAIFTLPALAFAYFIYRRKLPVRVSSVFHPFLGDRIDGPIGRIIDIGAVIGTLFGVSVSIGLGTLQINSGLSTLFGIPESSLVQVVLIAIVTAIATTSVVLGLDKGIKRLSNINILMAVGLMLFILFTGSTLFLFRGTIETMGTYLSMLVPLSFWNDTFGNTGWQDSWTVFYWAWTITWSPFVGIFIARISKGRTLREFVLGVLGLPTLFTVVWFSIFGLSAIRIERTGPGGLVQEVVDQGDIPGALFAFLENFPLTTLVSGIAVVIVVIFFTTSSDSASLVVDMLCSGDPENSPTRQRVFWALLEGVVAATLLAATGTAGLNALQEVITVIGLPFFLMAGGMMVALVMALRQDVGTVSPDDEPRGRRPERRVRLGSTRRRGRAAATEEPASEERAPEKPAHEEPARGPR